MDGGTVMGSKVFTAGSTVVHPLSSERKALHIGAGQTMHSYIIGDVGRNRMPARVVFEGEKPVLDLTVCLDLFAIADVSETGRPQQVLTGDFSSSRCLSPELSDRRSQEGR